MVKVLIVRADSAHREEIRTLLSGPHFDVEVAANVTEALKIAERFVPDLVIVDFGLQGGGEASDVFRIIDTIHARNPKSRSILTSGRPFDDVVQRYRDIPAVVCLTEPLESADLMAAVRKAVESL